MYTAVKGIYENGQVTFTEPAPTNEKSEVIVTFLGAQMKAPATDSLKTREGGWLKGWFEERGLPVPTLPDDFNEPLEDLKDYM